MHVTAAERLNKCAEIASSTSGCPVQHNALLTPTHPTACVELQLRKFDEGRRDDFFLLWQQYVPASQLGFDFETQKVSAQNPARQGWGA